MGTTRRATRAKAATPTVRAKAKAKRVARKAKKSLDVAAHEADLAIGRTSRRLKATARVLETTFEESKVPLKRRAKRVERKVFSTLESAGQLLTGALRRAKTRLTAGTKKSR